MLESFIAYSVSLLPVVIFLLAPDLYRHRFRGNPIAERVEQGAGRQYIDRDAKQILQFNLNGGHVHQRHFRGRVDKDIQVAFSDARAAQDRVEQSRVEHLGVAGAVRLDDI